MAVGFKGTTAASLLDAFGNATAYTGAAAHFMKLHTGDPGSAATSNAAGETTRKSLSWAAASSGTMANDVALTWTSYSTSETPTHFSIWDASSAGNFLASGTISASAITSGNTFTIAIGGVTATLSTAA